MTPTPRGRFKHARLTGVGRIWLNVNALETDAQRLVLSWWRALTDPLSIGVRPRVLRES
jgi:hypothetical protein